ncbi:MAG: hypothetical protein Q7T01_04265 [bacterium]|nr:hypothetical protein [bacterium]
MTTALEHVAECDVLLDGSRPPYTRFLEALRRRQAAARPGDIGTVWSGIPVDSVVAAGMSILVTRFAKDAGAHLRTTHDVERAATRVEAMVNLGLLLLDATPVSAVVQFEREVLLPALQRAQDGAMDGQTFIEYWQVPVAQFFADIIKRTRERVVTLHARLVRYHRANAFRPKRGMTYTAHDGFLDSDLFRWEALARLPWGAVEGMGYLRSTRAAAAAIRNAEHCLPALEACVRLLVLLPVRGIPADSIGGVAAYSVEQQWVLTQLLLTALDAPADADALPASQYPAAIAKIRTRSRGVIRRRFLARMDARGMHASVTERAGIERLVRDSFRIVRRWPTDVNDQVFMLCIMTLDSMDVVQALTPATALRVALGKEQALHEAAFQRGPKAVQELLHAVTARVEWSRCSAQLFAAVARADVLGPRHLAAAVMQLPVKYRNAAARIVCRRTGAFRWEFMARGYLPLDADAVLEHGSEVSSHALAVLLPRVLVETEATEAFPPASLAPQFLRLAAETMRATCTPPEARVIVTENVFRGIASGISDRHRRLQAGMARDMRKQFGDVLWRSYVLAGCVALRGDEFDDFALKPQEYLATLRESKLRPHGSWDALAQSAYVRTLLGVKNADAAAALLAELSEDAVLAWLHAHATRAARRQTIRVYLRNRDRYLKDVAS